MNVVLHDLGLHDLGLFMATVLVLNATPGVDMMLTASRTLQHGVRGGLATALGVSLGCIGHTLAAAFGLAAVLAASSMLFATLRWVGAAYLLWIAIGLLRGAFARRARAEEAPVPRQPQPETRASAVQLVRQGLLTNLLNPKIALFFLALLPQFIEAEAPRKGVAFLVLGALMILQGAVFLAGFVLLVSQVRRVRARPWAARSLQGAGGVLLIGLSARLALAER